MRKKITMENEQNKKQPEQTIDLKSMTSSQLAILLNQQYANLLQAKDNILMINREFEIRDKLTSPVIKEHS